MALKLKTKEQTQISQTLSRDTAKYTNLINRQILFDDNQICSYNNINLPAFTENAQVHRESHHEVINSLLGIFSRLYDDCIPSL